MYENYKTIETNSNNLSIIGVIAPDELICPKCGETRFNEVSVKNFMIYSCKKCRYCLRVYPNEQTYEYIYELENAPKPTLSQVFCPYCKSTNVKKITATGRMLSMSMFGLASGKLGKQWHCNSCKSDF